MSKFPDAVIRAMHNAGTTVTCLPVAVERDAGEHQSPGNPDPVHDVGRWESAIFFVLPLSVTAEQLKSLFPSSRLFPVSLEADVIEHEQGTLIELGLEIDLGLAEKPAGRVLFLTGHISAHHEAVALLAQQQAVSLFIGDVHCNLLHQQQIPLQAEHRQVFDDMLQEALKRDSLIKMTGKYDPEAVFDSIANSS